MQTVLFGRFAKTKNILFAIIFRYEKAEYCRLPFAIIFGYDKAELFPVAI